jgi:ABC-type multidrug transport system fused ATPase/permease subunit
VRLEGVSYAYPARDGLVLDGVDLELNPDETVALVGPSGGGKSTLASIVLGLTEPTAGRVLLGGAERRRGDLATWRRGIAWVPQSATIFSGTGADNIRLGDPGADDEAVRGAAQLAVSSSSTRFPTATRPGWRRWQTGVCGRARPSRSRARSCVT